MPDTSTILIGVGIGCVLLAAARKALRHLPQRNARIVRERTEQAARTKGGLVVEDHRDDSLTGVMDAVAEPARDELIETLNVLADDEAMEAIREAEAELDEEDLFVNGGYCPGPGLSYCKRYCGPLPGCAYSPGAIAAQRPRVEPMPTLREESINPLYVSRVTTIYGLSVVHIGCLAARRDHATDYVCPDCGKAFGRVTA